MNEDSQQGEEPDTGRSDGPSDPDRKADKDDHSDQKKPDAKTGSDGDEELKNQGNGSKGDDKPPLYKRPIFWVIVLGVGAIVLVGGILYYLHSRKYKSTDDAFVDAHIVRIAAETTGRLTYVAALDNDRVHRGEILATIAPEAPESTLAEAKASVAQADSQIGQAQAQVDIARANLASAIANSKVPLAEADRASADYARYLKLRRIDPSAAAPTQISQARSQAEAANAQALAARKQIDTASANIGSALKQVSAMQAQRRSSQARVSQANVSVSYLTIRAPIDGTIANRQVNVGTYVAPGQQLLAIVPDDMWITANFKETQLTLMRPGLPVSIKVDAFPDQKFNGHVESIQRGSGQIFQLLPPQNATGNYVKVVQRVPVRIRFNDNSWRKFMIGPGMSVSPTVTIRP